MPVVSRVKAILVQPKAEWVIIDGEPATIWSIYTSYVMIVAAIPAVCGAIGSGWFGMSIGSLLLMMVGRYAGSLIGVWILSVIINALAPMFGGQKDAVRAYKVAAYSATASWVVGVVGLIPALSILELLGLYSLYLLYLGLPVLMKTPADQAQSYAAVVIVAAIVVFVAMGFFARLVGLDV